jgi:hypothetical protein
MKGGIFFRQISLQICDWSKTQQMTLFSKNLPHPHSPILTFAKLTKKTSLENSV